MRGTDSEEDFNTFVEAISGFPPTRRGKMSPGEVFLHSYNLLKRLAAKESPPFPRARAWQAYALALSVSESWPLPEANADPKKRVEEACALAEKAVALDKTDYDLWWALANTQLIRGQFDKTFFPKALSSFKKALDLNRDEKNPNLYAEVADAMVHLGDQAGAEKYIRKALHKPDWHHWIRAWAYFMKAGRYPETGSLFLDHALDEVKNTSAQPGDPNYLAEMQLLLAAIHARKRMLVSGQPVMAEWHKAAVKLAMARFLEVFPKWNQTQANAFAPFQDGNDTKYWEASIAEVLTLSPLAPEQ